MRSQGREYDGSASAAVTDETGRCGSATSSVAHSIKQLTEVTMTSSPTRTALSFYFATGRGVKYCDECLYVCMSVRSHISKPRPNFTKFSVLVTCGRGLVILR